MMERSLRIAHVSPTFPPYHGGTGNVCYHQAQVLARRGHDVHVFTANYPGTPADPPGVTVHRLAAPIHAGNAPLMPSLLWRLRGFDVIHLHYPFLFGGELAAFSSWHSAVPLVMNYHSDLIPVGWKGPIFSAYERVVSPRLFRYARRVIVVTAAHGRTARAAPILAHRGEAVIEIPNGVDLSVFRPLEQRDRDLAREKLGLHGERGKRPILVFVGSLDAAHHYKGLRVLLRAFAAVRTRALLVVVGDGNDRRRYEAITSELGIADDVLFAGAKPPPELARILGAADGLVMPSEVPESFGMVLIEAMACAIPVIASDSPGPRSIVDEGRDGFLVPPGDVQALSRAIETWTEIGDAKRHAMGCAGRRKVEERYGWSRIGDQLEALYTDVMAERSLCRAF